MGNSCGSLYTQNHISDSLCPFLLLGWPPYVYSVRSTTEPAVLGTMTLIVCDGRKPGLFTCYKNTEASGP